MTRILIRAAGVAAVLGAAVAAVAAAGPAGVARADDKGPPSKEAVDRTRDEVRKLDDLYKAAVVVITKTYVNQQFDTPAAKVAADVFHAMKAKGHHDARLVDVTGRPKNEDNVARTAFEKAAVLAMKGGKPYAEEVGERDGKPVLRAATVVPAVMRACASCHGKKEGELLGAIVYEVPIR